MPDSSLSEIRAFLRGETESPSVVTMPDFFFDRLVSLKCDVRVFSAKLDGVVKRKGGSIDGVAQGDLRGGNAVNTASALKALGAHVVPIVCTNSLGLQLIRFYLGSSKMDFSHVKILSEPSITTAIELEVKGVKVNVMLRSVGSLGDFGPSDLSEKDFQVIEKADYVYVSNWAGTRRFGTELAEVVFRHAKIKGRGRSYCDTADPTPNATGIPRLVRNVLRSRNLDILSVNENEAVCYASHLCKEVRDLRKRLRFADLATESARILASRLPARIDLHATCFSATFAGKSETIVSAFRVPVLRVTGAGDAWNAGNIFGYANELSDEARLTLANAVAAYYISDRKGLHPTKTDLIRFSEKMLRHVESHHEVG